MTDSLFRGRGQHSMIDLNGCIIPSKNTEAVLLKLNLCLKDICLRNSLRVVGEKLVIFDGSVSPSGGTIAILLDESHITLHSYGEEGIIACDLFTCAKDPINHAKAICEIKRLMGDVFPQGWISGQHTVARFVKCDPPDDMFPYVGPTPSPDIKPIQEHWSHHPVDPI